MEKEIEKWEKIVEIPKNQYEIKLTIYLPNCKTDLK